MKRVVPLAKGQGTIMHGWKTGTHMLRQSLARHLWMNNIHINCLSRWMGYSSIQTTLIYLELLPGPRESWDRVL